MCVIQFLSYLHTRKRGSKYDVRIAVVVELGKGDILLTKRKKIPAVKYEINPVL